MYLQIATHEEVPSEAEFLSWVSATIGDDQREICIRVVDEEEGCQLNKKFAYKDQATNVLAFGGGSANTLGDIAICAPVVMREAQKQTKPLYAHYAHIVVHGTLHLLGYGHDDERSTRRMEAREIAILGQFGIKDPYEVND